MTAAPGAPGPAWLLGEVLQGALWWAHALAATAWIGGALFYVYVLRPVARGATAPDLSGAGVRFGELVEACAVVLLVSGAVMALQRLSSGAASGTYVAVLGIKVLLALAMSALAWELRLGGKRRKGAHSGVRPSLSRLSLALGIIVSLLAVVLRRLFEAGLVA